MSEETQEPQEPETVPEPPEAPVEEDLSILDEASQAEVDRRVVRATMFSLRQRLAQVKVNRALNRLGVLPETQGPFDGTTKGHDRQFVQVIEHQRIAIEMLKDLDASIGEHGIAEGGLEVATDSDVQAITAHP